MVREGLTGFIGVAALEFIRVGLLSLDSIIMLRQIFINILIEI